ncbi:MAG: hypothetical protein ACOCWQ_03140 [Nanoarchaeota archaeon]
MGPEKPEQKETRPERQIAHILSIQDLRDGEYKVQDGWNPNYVRTTWGAKVARVHLVGTVVDKQEQGQRFSIDDGSTPIEMRSFDPIPHFEAFNVGSIIRVIGKPRMFNDTLYIAPEIIRVLDDPKWVRLHNAYIEKLAEQRTPFSEEEGVELNHNDLQETQDDNSDIIELIEGLDKGDGVTKQQIVDILKEKTEVDDPVSTYERLLLHGEIFEIRPDVVKVLK